MDIVSLIVSGFQSCFGYWFSIMNGYEGGILLALFIGMFLLTQLYRFILMPIFVGMDMDTTEYFRGARKGSFRKEKFAKKNPSEGRKQLNGK